MEQLKSINVIEKRKRLCYFIFKLKEGEKSMQYKSLELEVIEFENDDVIEDSNTPEEDPA